MRPMDYVEHAAPADLRRHVQCLWILRDDAPGDADVVDEAAIAGEHEPVMQVLGRHGGQQR